MNEQPRKNDSSSKTPKPQSIELEPAALNPESEAAPSPNIAASPTSDEIQVDEHKNVVVAPETQVPAASVPDVKQQSEKAPATSAAPAQEPTAVQQADIRPVNPESPVNPGRPDDVLTTRMPGHEAADAAVLALSRRHTRRSFVLAGASAAAAAGFYKWLDVEPETGMQPNLLRRAFHTNAALSRALTRDAVLSPTYPLSRAETLRVNGIYGLKQELVPDSWRLQLVGSGADAQHPQFTPDVTAWNYRYRTASTSEDQGHDTKVDPKLTTAGKMAPAPMVGKAAQDESRTGPKPRGTEEAGHSQSTLAPGTSGLLLTMDDLLHFPRHELVTEFKCIEGWSQIVHWAGIRLADLLGAYPPAPIDGREPKYIYMETPDGDYYTGYDLDVCRHPQTLLVTEMMGVPLTQFHGAPLRLHMPTKYGYKQIKRIGLISYTNLKPDDYWTKLGYDWYAGL